MEDDPMQSEWIAEEVIWKKFPDAEILFFDSEYSFIKGLESGEIKKWKPQHAIMDLLVRYYSIQDLSVLDSPPDFSNIPDPKSAGIRCRKLLLDACPYIQTHAVIVTVLDPPEGDFSVIQKGSDNLSEELFKFLCR